MKKKESMTQRETPDPRTHGGFNAQDNLGLSPPTFKMAVKQLSDELRTYIAALFLNCEPSVWFPIIPSLLA